MTPIPFFKMSGSGNDFIIIDNREEVVPEDRLKQLVVGSCRRKMSVGADGMMLVEASQQVDFKWRFFNADGSLPDMCGNGARCAARFAFLNGIAGRQMAFETLAGVIEAEAGDHGVKIRMTDPRDVKIGYSLDLGGTVLTVSSINTGVPHVVAMVDDIEAVDVVPTGRLIRQHREFALAALTQRKGDVLPHAERVEEGAVLKQHPHLAPDFRPHIRTGQIHSEKPGFGLQIAMRA